MLPIKKLLEKKAAANTQGWYGRIQEILNDGECLVVLLKTRQTVRASRAVGGEHYPVGQVVALNNSSAGGLVTSGGWYILGRPAFALRNTGTPTEGLEAKRGRRFWNADPWPLRLCTGVDGQIDLYGSGFTEAPEYDPPGIVTDALPPVVTPNQITMFPQAADDYSAVGLVNLKFPGPYADARDEQRATIRGAIRVSNCNRWVQTINSSFMTRGVVGNLGQGWLPEAYTLPIASGDLAIQTVVLYTGVANPGIPFVPGQPDVEALVVTQTTAGWTLRHDDTVSWGGADANPRKMRTLIWTKVLPSGDPPPGVLLSGNAWAHANRIIEVYRGGYDTLVDVEFETHSDAAAPFPATSNVSPAVSTNPLARGSLWYGIATYLTENIAGNEMTIDHSRSRGDLETANQTGAAGNTATGYTMSFVRYEGSKPAFTNPARHFEWGLKQLSGAGCPWRAQSILLVFADL